MSLTKMFDYTDAVNFKITLESQLLTFFLFVSLAGFYM